MLVGVLGIVVCTFAAIFILSSADVEEMAPKETLLALESGQPKQD